MRNCSDLPLLQFTATSVLYSEPCHTIKWQTDFLYYNFLINICTLYRIFSSHVLVPPSGWCPWVLTWHHVCSFMCVCQGQPTKHFPLIVSFSVIVSSWSFIEVDPKSVQITVRTRWKNSPKMEHQSIAVHHSHTFTNLFAPGVNLEAADSL